MSKRKNRELAEREAAYRLSRNPHYIAGALASGVPADINPALALCIAALKAQSK